MMLVMINHNTNGLWAILDTLMVCLILGFIAFNTVICLVFISWKKWKKKKRRKIGLKLGTLLFKKN